MHQVKVRLLAFDELYIQKNKIRSDSALVYCCGNNLNTFIINILLMEPCDTSEVCELLLYTAQNNERGNKKWH